MMWERRAILATGGIALAGVAATRLSGRMGRLGIREFRPEDFGAKGDGKANDTAAFDALSAAVNANGGGAIVLRRATYLVGMQNRSPSKNGKSAYLPSTILRLQRCTEPLSIWGNGARLVAASGLRYGTFDAARQMPTHRTLPFYDPAEVASPYVAMISIENCSGSVLIEDLELEGNASGMILGGPWGDRGWQIAGSGIRLTDNTGDEIIRRVTASNHPLDGLMIDGISARSAATARRRIIEDFHANANGRQGCSIVGGQDYSFNRCSFSRSGRGTISSAPVAGLDVEAEDKRITGLRFTECEFADNSGCGLLLDSGDSDDMKFERCRFIGTTSWSAWPRKPNVSFKNCEFVGAIANAFGSADAEKATHFLDCTFRDDPALSPSAKVFVGGSAIGTIADLSTEPNISFARCRFLLTHAAVLPWSVRAIYSDCVMRQTNGALSYPRGTYRGRTSIIGNAALTGSLNEGEIIVNGRSQPRGRF